ncbi:MAG: hypothetical protein ACI9NT_001619 [Bacteroidia bacterium]
MPEGGVFAILTLALQGNDMINNTSPSALRARIRMGQLNGNTSGLAPGYVQCNIVILPAAVADNFRRFCELNPRPCPIVAVGKAGDPGLPELGDIDIRQDVPAYRVFRQGQLSEEVSDISDLWTDEMVTFALGCSFSFEEALLAEGLEIRNVTESCNVPMYKTNLDCLAAAPFSGKMVVSMRPFSSADAPRATRISEQFPAVHGAPIHQGDPTAIGIDDLSKPDFGDPVTLHRDEIPLFWACGVTPQLALQNARLPLAITHSPGSMLITDLRNAQLAAS